MRHSKEASVRKQRASVRLASYMRKPRWEFSSLYQVSSKGPLEATIFMTRGGSVYEWCQNMSFLVFVWLKSENLMNFKVNAYFTIALSNFFSRFPASNFFKFQLILEKRQIICQQTVNFFINNWLICRFFWCKILSS